MLGISATFSKAITFVEFERSGNPQEKYKPGINLLAEYFHEATLSGSYCSYIDQIILETNARYSELEREVEAYSKATFKLSMEHLNPEQYMKMRLLELLDEDRTPD